MLRELANDCLFGLPVVFRLGFLLRALSLLQLRLDPHEVPERILPADRPWGDWCERSASTFEHCTRFKLMRSDDQVRIRCSANRSCPCPDVRDGFLRLVPFTAVMIQDNRTAKVGCDAVERVVELHHLLVIVLASSLRQELSRSQF